MIIVNPNSDFTVTDYHSLLDKMNDIKSISSSVETPQTQSTNNGNGFKAD
jgi:hypothetical protein